MNATATHETRVHEFLAQKRIAVAGGSKNLEEARVGFKGVTAACGSCHAVHKKPPAS